MNKAIGIDLGTTNSCATYYKSLDGVTGAPIVIPMGLEETIPSCVSLVNGEYIIGREAYKQRYLPNTAYSVKRQIGISDSISLTDSVTGEVRTLSPKDISALILAEMKKVIDRDFGKTDQVTITVPAHFSALQTRLTQEAGIDAGWKEVSIIKEPTAASLAYQIETDKESEKILVFDLGGGTFDVALVELITPQETATPATTPEDDTSFLTDFYGIDETTPAPQQKVVRVLASDGDVQLGGDDIDKTILKRVFYTNSLAGTDLAGEYPEGSEDYEKLLLSVEQIKKEGYTGAVHSKGNTINISMDDIEFGYNKIMRKCVEITKSLLTKHGDKVDRIILVGGSTKSPFVAKYLQKALDVKEISSSLNPDTTVALGASINSALKLGISNTKFIDIVPETIGILQASGVPLTALEEGTPLPAQGTLSMETIDDKEINMHFVGRRGVLLGTLHIPSNAKGTKVEIRTRLSLDSILSVEVITKDQKLETTLSLANLKAVDSDADISRKDRRRLANIKEMHNKLASANKLTEREIKANLEMFSSLTEAKNFDTEWKTHSKQIKSLSDKYKKYVADVKGELHTSTTDYESISPKLSTRFTDV